MKSKIANFYVDNGDEACGFILASGQVVSVPNVAKDPKEAFEMADDHVDKYLSKAVATWHTHPRTGCNLSVEDYACFLAFPNIEHYIYDGSRLACYTVDTETGYVLLKEIL